MVGATLAVTATTVQASPPWSVVPSANPSAATFSQLRGVSCPSAKSCFAVGTFSQGAVGKRLIEHWNGSSWSVMSSPIPAGATFSRLLGVSCPSTRSCFAVGSYSVGPTGAFGLIEHWNGTNWGIMTNPNPGATFTGFVAVSCPSTRSCFAVGSNNTASSTNQTLAEHWDGTSWSLMDSPNPAGTTPAVLYGVSCPSTTSCIAIGYYSPMTGDRTLAEHWNGSSWGIMTAADPNDSTGTDPDGIFCPSTKSCFVGGSYHSGMTSKSLLMHWNGTNWSVMPHSLPAGGSYGDFYSISCPSLRSCFATGGYATATAGRALVEHWNGSSWGIMTVPNPGTTGDLLYGVSCPALRSCVAVGYQSTAMLGTTLVERYP